jgi:hypothetical protein
LSGFFNKKGKTIIRHEIGLTFALCGKYVGSIIVFYLLAENFAGPGRMDEKLLE